MPKRTRPFVIHTGTFSSGGRSTIQGRNLILASKPPSRNIKGPHTDTHAHQALLPLLLSSSCLSIFQSVFLSFSIFKNHNKSRNPTLTPESFFFLEQVKNYLFTTRVSISFESKSLFSDRFAWITWHFLGRSKVALFDLMKLLTKIQRNIRNSAFSNSLTLSHCVTERSESTWLIDSHRFTCSWSSKIWPSVSGYHVTWCHSTILLQTQLSSHSPLFRRKFIVFLYKHTTKVLFRFSSSSSVWAFLCYSLILPFGLIEPSAAF